MTTAFQRFAILAALVILAPSLARAQDAPDPYPVHEVSLDIDRDGKMDRAVLRGKEPGNWAYDLYIYLDAGDGPLDPARQPSFIKKDAAPATVQYLEVVGKTKSSLRVSYGCGGCSNDYERALTIIHRGGTFIVAGYTLEWETRDFGMGTCDINFLTGKGFISRGLNGKQKPVKGRFVPVKLADWDDEKAPGVCAR